MAFSRVVEIQVIYFKGSVLDKLSKLNSLPCIYLHRNKPRDMDGECVQVSAGGNALMDAVEFGVLRTWRCDARHGVIP